MRIEKILQDIRLRTDNVGNTAIGDDEILSYVNEAQRRLQSRIMQEHPESDTFAMTAFISMVQNVEVYPLTNLKDVNGGTLPDTFFAGNCISLVERSSGVNGTWSPLDQISNKERSVTYGYFIQGNSIVISPAPNGALDSLRLTGMKRLKNLDKRRGKVQSQSVVGGKVQLVLTGVPADTTFLLVDKITIVDDNGAVATTINSGVPTYYAGLSVDNYNAGTLTLSIPSLSSVVGYYVLYESNSTTHSEVDEFAQRYLIEYASLRIFMRDSSKDFSPQQAFVSSIETEILASYAFMGSDANLIPITNFDYMGY